MAQGGFWNAALDWMEKSHGKTLAEDRKGTLKELLYELEVLIDEVTAVLDEHFVCLDDISMEPTKVEPLLVSNKLSSLFMGNCFILNSEVDECLKSDVKEEIEFLSEDEDYGDDPSSSSILDDEDDEGVYTCAKCSSVHESYDDLVDHLQSCIVKSPKRKRRTKHPIEDRTCKTCSKTFSTLNYLKRVHSQKCYKASPELDPVKDYLLKCSNCSKAYKCVSHYYLHIKTCGVAEPVFDKVDTRSLKGVTCHKCGFIASSKEEFQNKAHKCEPIKLFKCLKCDFEAYERSSVRNHDFAVHQKDKALHVCEICGATFSYKCGLTRHLKTHLEKIPCPKCGKIFSRQFTLNRHLDNFHKPTQDHPCEICGKTFKALRYLKRHISSQHPESGELEKHECMHCHSFFREKAYLKKHIRKKHTKV